VLPVANKGVEDQDTDAVAEEPIKVLEAQSTFDDFIVWDHETLAAADDTFVKGVEEWIKFAEVVWLSLVVYSSSLVNILS
jgi:ribonuclease H2 subunit C